MALFAAALYGLDILFLVAFQVMNRDFRLLSHAVSDYGMGQTARLFSAYLVVGSVAAPVLAWLFWTSRVPDYPVSISIYLIVAMLGRIGLGLFPVDPRGAVRTRTGQIHRAATLLAFTCAYMTIAEAEPLLSATAGAPLPAFLTGMKHAISAGFICLVLTMSEPLRRFFGLAERLFLYASALWFVLASLSFTAV